MFSRTLLSLASAAVMAATTAGCNTTPTHQQIGTGAGAAVGGLAGHALTGGSTLGTVGGAAVGGVVGNEMTKPK